LIQSFDRAKREITMASDRDVACAISGRDDRISPLLAARPMAAFAAGLFVVLLASDAFAQRGGQHLNSPGYQRALIESRKPKAEVLPQTTTLKKKRPRRPRAE
jgi:hypothetical protein